MDNYQINQAKILALRFVPNHLPKLTLLICAVSLSVAPALAQNKVYMPGDKLQPVIPFHAPRQLQIIDEGPILKDCRRAPEASPDYMVIIGPGPKAAPPNTVVLRAQPNNLPQSGFGTQIPAGGLSHANNLPATTMGGRAPVDAAPRRSARPMMTADNAVAGKVQNKPVASSTPLTFGRYPSGESLANGSAYHTSETSAELRGRLVGAGQSK